MKKSVPGHAISERSALDGIHKELLGICTSKMREGQTRYFKETVKFLGCSLPQCEKVAKEWSGKLKEDGWTYDDVMGLAEGLLKKGTFEEGQVGLELVSHERGSFRKSDLAIFERWILEYVNNWAHTDHIAPHIVGELLGMYPDLSGRIFPWTKSENRWLRRAAAVTFVLHARRGKFLDEVFKVAYAMMGDEDDMVQKGVGWVLKEASKSDTSAVVEFLVKNKERTSRLVLRYATEKMGAKDKDAVLGRRSGIPEKK
jgi:3-methyladenine DNA glycosylase AlkD